jgi:hypothetical protein
LNPSRGRVAAAVPAVLLIAALAAGCTGSAPSIDDVRWRVVLRDDGARRYEELALFVLASDPDGPGDLALVEAIPRGSDLVWRAQAPDWSRSPADGMGWIGLPRLVPASGERLPDGLWTVRVSDLAGRSAETTFRLDPARVFPPDGAWPVLAVRGGRVSLTGPYESAVVFYRDAAGEVLGTASVRSGSPFDPGDAVEWEGWIPLDDASSGFRLGPYPVDAGAVSASAGP